MLTEDTGGRDDPRPLAVLTVVGVGTFLAALAGSAVNLALPDLGRELGISIESSRWVIQAFLLAVGVLALVAGRLADMFGHKVVYLTGFVIFGLSSVACGLVEQFWALVLLRATQGVGGAMLMAPGPALLTTTFPPHERGRALGMLATATYLGLTIGPSLGGVVVDSLGWRWTFFLNGPVSVIVFGMGWFFLPGRSSRQRADPEKKSSFDWPGALALLMGLPFLMLALSRSHGPDGGDWWTWSAAGLGAAALVSFVLIQRRSASPLLDLSLFNSRIFSGAVLSAVCNYIALFAMILLLPFYLEEGLGRSPTQAGLLLSVHPLVMALVASPSGWLSDRLGSRGLAVVGMLILAGGLSGLAFLGAGAQDGQVILWLGLVGLGTGIFISPNSSALMGAAPRGQQGTAGSMLAESRVVGMLLGVALASAVFGSAGGQTGQQWTATDFGAYTQAQFAAVGVALLGALSASLRGRPKPSA